MKTLIATALLMLAPALQAAEEKPLPKDLPAYGQDKPLPVAQIARKTLPNGLQIWVLTRSGFPKVDMELVVRGGTASDPAERAWVSSLMAELLIEGTKTRSSRQLAEELQAIGGSVGGSASEDGIWVSGSAFKGELETLLVLAADVALNPSFPAAEVELAKANTLQSLQAQEAQPGFHANRAYEAAIYGAHPYHFTTLTPAVTQSVTPAELAKLHAQRFRPDRALLVIGGEIDAERAFALAEKAFGGWKSNAAAVADVPPAPASAPSRHVVIDRPGSVQSTLRIGRPAVAASSADAIPLEVANVMLGGSFGSRITRNIREDKGYTYSPHTNVSQLKVGGAMTLRADVRSDVTGATINEVLYEFNRMGTTDVGTEELAAAKRYVSGTYLFENQLQGAVVGTLAAYWVLGLPPEFLAEYVGKVNAVSVDQVRDVSRKYFAAKDQTIVVVGDKAKIARDLAQYGEFVAPK